MEVTATLAAQLAVKFCVKTPLQRIRNLVVIFPDLKTPGDMRNVYICLGVSCQ
jgi:hypothetical protein